MTQRVRDAAGAVMLCGGFALTAWGLHAHRLLEQVELPGWMPAAGFVACALALAGLGEVLRVRFGISRLAAGGLVIAALGMMAGALWPLVVVLAQGAACWVLGTGILRPFGSRDEPNDGVAVALGMACLGTLVFAFARLPIAYPAVYGAVLVLILMAGHRGLRSLAQRLAQGGSDGVALMEVAILLVVAYEFLVALMPEAGHDALAVHLFVPGQLAWRHKWSFDAGTYAWAVMPMLADWLYGIAYVLAGETAARLINFGAVLLAALLVADLARAAGASVKASRWASLLLLSTPLTFAETSSVFVEPVWIALLMGATVLLFDAARRTQDGATTPRASLAGAGLLIGAALATKAVTFVLLPGFIAFLVFAQRGRLLTRSSAAMALGALLCAAIGCLPYIDAWRVTGNPVFPFFNNVFKSTLWYAEAFQAPEVFEKGFGWKTLYAMTFQSGRFLEGRPGAAGFQWLLLTVPCLVMALVWRRAAALWLFALGALSLVLTFQSTAYLRYVFPAFAWCSAGIAAGAAAVQDRMTRGFMDAALLAAVALNLVFLKSGTLAGDLEPAALLSAQGRQDYIEKQLPMRSLVSAVNALNTRGSPVAVLGTPAVAGLQADALHASWYNVRFQDAVRFARSGEALVEALASQRVEYILLDEVWGNPDRRLAVRSIAEHVADAPGAQLLRLKPELRFRHELLRATHFDPMDAWSTAGVPPQRAADGIVVTAQLPVFQAAPVVPGRAYRLLVRARCSDAGAQGRYQVNWLDGRGQFLGSTISLFDCGPTMEPMARVLQAPAQAGTAIVYATSHSERGLVVQELSFSD